MRRYLLLWACLGMTSLAGWASAADYVFEGPWNTTNRRLDGIMTCTVTELGARALAGTLLRRVARCPV